MANERSSIEDRGHWRQWAHRVKGRKRCFVSADYDAVAASPDLGCKHPHR